MGKFKLSSKQRFSVQGFKKYWPLIIVVLLVLSQVERFISQGTVLGYQVRRVQSKQSIARQNRSGSILNGQVAKENQKSIACDTFPSDKVSKVVEAEVERISGFVPDRTTPSLTSSCIYRTKSDKKNIRTISILYREQKDEAAAQKTLATLRQAKNGEEVKKLGNEAFFNSNANQLTVRSGKRLITVTVPHVETAAKSSKDTAIEIAKIGL